MEEGAGEVEAEAVAEGGRFVVVFGGGRSGYGGGGVCGEVEAGEEGLKSGVVVDEGSKDGGDVVDDCAERR